VTAFRAITILSTLFLTACVCGPAVSTQPSPSSSASPSATLASTPSPSSTPTPTSTAVPTSDPTAAAFFTTHTKGWRPVGATLVVSEMKYTGPGPNDATIVAVPVDGAAVTRLVSVRENPVPAMRPDGGALAAAVGGGLALWETSGTVRWMVAPDSAVGNSNPVWSPDGTYLYFGRWKKSPSGDLGEDLGIFRVRPDGSDLRNAVPGQPPGQGPPLISVPRMVTKQNILLWGRAYEGASVEVLDFAIGRKRTYDGGVGDVAAWRDTQPRALIEGCSNTGCRGLVLWNDETGAKQQVLGDDVQVQGADYAPSGGRIVVARLSNGWGLDIVDGTSVVRIAGSANAQWPRWVDANIAYLWGPADNAIGIIVTEVRTIAATGGAAPRTLYRSSSNEYALFFRDIVGR
jgi:hypothetical protein